MTKKLTSSELRSQFLNYFQKLQHTIVPSSSLIPGTDPTLLFTNAGMVQFKDVFLGDEKRPYTKAASSQKCVRAGGKHNDLENVGYTARHHTFFEMLGNFSFGDYFKHEAIRFAWDFLTKELELPPEKLWITVYEEDSEAENIWKNEIKIDPTRFSKCGAKDNFWSMGDTGPCGPCTEIFYDHGPEIAGGPPGSPDADGDRYVEIWNLVFMQFDRNEKGELKPLPKPSVDTGSGLERLSAVLQRKHNNYDTDCFTLIIKKATELAKVANTNNIPEKTLTSLRVIADHIRSCAFLIADGVVPSNEGRGYVLRRIIRRAVRHGQKLNIESPFFWKLVDPLIAIMGDAYPELIHRKEVIIQILHREEEQFEVTLEKGLKIFEQTIDRNVQDTKLIPGDIVFLLYDTYGFPVDLTEDMARERNLSIDFAGFEQEMEKQRKRSQETSKFELKTTAQFAGKTEFTGYENEALQEQAIITHIYPYSENADEKQDIQPIQELLPGQLGIIVLNTTPFYAESGGQVGDQGILELVKGNDFIVKNTQKRGTAYLHIGKSTTGTFKVGDKVLAIVNKNARQATALNHSATHLLHAALRKVLGNHVTQKGSLVEPERLRFDFAHHQPLTVDELNDIENLVNQEIRANYKGEVNEGTPEEAVKKGAMALFGEKYGEKVRTLKFGSFSHEICGGTHVARTGDIGLFKIIAESGIAAGVRRIEAVTGLGALQWVSAEEAQLQEAASLLKTTRDTINNKLQQILDHNRDLEKRIEQLQTKLAATTVIELAQQAQIINGIKLLTSQLDDTDNKTLRTLLDQLKNKLGSAVVVLATAHEGKVSIVAGVAKEITAKIKAGDLVNFVAQQVGGKGGGRPDMAEAGGNNPAGLTNALASVKEWVENKLNS